MVDTNHCVYYWNKETVIFAGEEEDEGSRHGTALYSRFYAPSVIAVEFDNVIYVSDSVVGSVKLLRTLKEKSIVFCIP